MPQKEMSLSCFWLQGHACSCWLCSSCAHRTLPLRLPSILPGSVLCQLRWPDLWSCEWPCLLRVAVIFFPLPPSVKNQSMYKNVWGTNRSLPGTGLTMWRRAEDKASPRSHSSIASNSVSQSVNTFSWAVTVTLGKVDVGDVVESVRKGTAEGDPVSLRRWNWTLERWAGAEDLREERSCGRHTRCPELGWYSTCLRFNERAGVTGVQETRAGEEGVAVWWGGCGRIERALQVLGRTWSYSKWKGKPLPVREW